MESAKRLFQATGNYSGMIGYYSPQQQLQRREPVDVSFELRHSFSGAALLRETTAISYNLANRASPQNIERYISAGRRRPCQLRLDLSSAECALCDW